MGPLDIKNPSESRQKNAQILNHTAMSFAFLIQVVDTIKMVFISDYGFDNADNATTTAARVVEQ